MRKIFLALGLWLSACPFPAWAQCTGVFPANSVCGTVAGGIPTAVPSASFGAGLAIGTTTIAGGVNTQVLYNNAGVLGNYTNTQLTALINQVSASASGAVPAFPNNTTTYFRGDGTFAGVPFSVLTGTIGAGQFATGPGVLTPAMLNNAAASTFLGNPTAGAAARTDFTIDGLTNKSTPVGADELIIADSAASFGLKKCTISNCVSALGVTSFNTRTGAVIPIRGDYLGWFNVKQSPYNAVCDGSTDDSTALQAAITAAEAVNGTVYIPTGTCKFGTTLTIADSGSQIDVRITGDGFGSILSYSGATTGIAVTGAAQNRVIYTMDNVQLVVSNTAANGVAVTNANVSTFRRTKITGGKQNIVYVTSFKTFIEDNFLGGTQQAAIFFTADSSGNAATIVGNGIYSTNGAASTFPAIDFGNGNGIEISGNDIETGYTPVLFRNGVTSVSFRGNHTELMTGAPFNCAATAAYIDITGNTFDANTVPTAVTLGCFDNINVDKNTFSGWQVSFAGTTNVNLGNNDFLNSASITNALWGTYTPALSCGTATFTVNSATAKVFGNTTYVELDAVISAIGTCVSVVQFTLPSTPRNVATMAGREQANTADPVTCATITASTLMQCTKGVVAAWAANDRVTVTGVYQNQ